MADKKYILEESLGYVLGRAARSMGALVNHRFAAAGHEVTCEQWSILVHLSRCNGQPQQELAANVCKDKTSITRLIDNMEKHNLVVRIPDKTDKRHKLIYLTKKGKDLYAALLVHVKDILQQAQKGINAKDLELCKKVLHQVYENTRLNP